MRSGDKEQIAGAMRLYNNGGNAGLNRRREAEIQLMNTPYMSDNPYNRTDMSPNPYR